MEKLELKQMQELLVDYVLNRISDEDKKMFEANLEFYPELEEELIQSQKLFNRIEKTNFNKIASNRTRNTTYKVRQKYKLSKSEKRIRFTTKIIFPSLGLVAIILLMITTIDFSGFISPNSDSILPKNLFADVDFDKFDDNQISNSNIYTIESIELPSDISEEIYSDYTIDFIENDELLKLAESNLVLNNQNDNLYSSLNEEEFQKIYEEIKNEKFDF